MGKKGREYILLFVTTLLFILLFLVSCQPPEAKSAETLIDTDNVSIAGCAPQWECAEDYQVQVLENCTRVNPTKCERGCVNGTCRPAEICTTGFKCIDDFRRGYQKEDCSFATKSDCEWGCLEGKCQEKPTNVSNQANVSTISSTASESPTYSAIEENLEEKEEKKTIYSLKIGEQQQIEINSMQTNVSIHFLEPNQVTLTVNGVKSSPILEQGNFTYENIGATFHIEWILFQSYAGGKQEIGYSVK